MAMVEDKEAVKANNRYIRTSMKQALLGKDEELELARRWREEGDERAMHQLVNAYTRLVIAMASKFRHYGLSLADLIQEGNVGLMLAAQRFEPQREIRFSTYSTWWIKAQMQDYVLRNWSIVRTGTTSAQKSLFFNLRRLRARIEERKGRNNLTDEDRGDIAKLMGVKITDVNNMEQRLMGGDQSLNIKIGENEDDEWQSLLADDRPNPEEVVIGMKDANTRSAWLSNALSELNDREKTIIRRRHLGDSPVTLEDLGKALGVSKERVRQLEARAMGKIKSSLIKQVDNREALFA